MCVSSDSWGRGHNSMVNIAGPLKHDPVVVSIESPLNDGYCSSAKHSKH